MPCNGVNIYTQQKKLRKSQKTIEQTNTKANNYSVFSYLFKYISSVENDASFSFLAQLPLLWHYVKYPRGQSHFSQKKCLQSIPSFDAKHMNELYVFKI